MLHGKRQKNLLFSPNFERYIDFDYSRDQFVIRNVHFDSEYEEKILDKENFYFTRDILDLEDHVLQ